MGLKLTYNKKYIHMTFFVINLDMLNKQTNSVAFTLQANYTN
jgi:hypothetical protein